MSSNQKSPKEDLWCLFTGIRPRDFPHKYTRRHKSTISLCPHWIYISSKWEWWLHGIGLALRPKNPSVLAALFSLKRPCKFYTKICAIYPWLVELNCLTWMFIGVLPRNLILWWTQKPALGEVYFYNLENRSKKGVKLPNKKEALSWRVFRCLVMVQDFVFTSGWKLWVSLLSRR